MSLRRDRPRQTTPGCGTPAADGQSTTRRARLAALGGGERHWNRHEEVLAGTATETAAAGSPAPASTEPFRFFDNREKYLLFVTTTSEKSVTAERIGRELARLRPQPPAGRIFDAGTGNGEVLSRVLRESATHTSSYDPLHVIGPIAPHAAELGIERLHVFTFNSVAETMAWRRAIVEP